MLLYFPILAIRTPVAARLAMNFMGEFCFKHSNPRQPVLFFSAGDELA